QRNQDALIAHFRICFEFRICFGFQVSDFGLNYPLEVLQGLTSMMELGNVNKDYVQGRRVVNAVRGVSMTIEAGEFVSIMGPSGSGKSTLMHLAGALDTPTTGQVLFQGRD